MKEWDLDIASLEDSKANSGPKDQRSEHHRPAELSLPALLESLLFVADGPVAAGRIAAMLDITPEAVLVLFEELEAAYAGRGLRLQWSGRTASN